MNYLNQPKCGKWSLNIIIYIGHSITLFQSVGMANFFLVSLLKSYCEVHHWSASYIRVSPKGVFSELSRGASYTRDLYPSIYVIWKSSLIIPIPKPGKYTSQRTSYRLILLLCPAAKVLESLLLPTTNKISPPCSRPTRFQTWTLDHLISATVNTTNIVMGFSQRRPPDRTVCVVVDLSGAFDTVCHNNLLSKINIPQLPPATARWLSCYLRGRQANTCFRGVKSTSRKVNTGVPQGTKLSSSLFICYIAGMPRPTNQVKRVWYADDLTVWASGVNIPDLEVSHNNYT